MEFTAATLEETGALACRLAGLLQPGDCILLKGELGAGKTAFARALIQELAPEKPEVASPTFTLLQQYDVVAGGRPCTLSHYDFYRLEEAREIEALGLGDALENSIVLIEWPQIAASYLPKDALEIEISHGAGERERLFSLRSSGNWLQRLEKL